MTELITIVPVADDVSAPYWEGAARGELRLQRCPNCHAVWHPPLPRCPRCPTPDAPQWFAATGEGVVESATVVHRAGHPAFADRVPYVVIGVRLTEGPLVVTNLVDHDDPERLVAVAPAGGTAVAVVFAGVAPGIALPQFRRRERA